MISIEESGSSISLRRIKLSSGHLSLIPMTDLSRGKPDDGEVTWKKILSAMVPNPVFSYARANRSVGALTEPKPSVSDFECFRKFSVYLLGISPDGRVNLETEFLIPNRSKLLWVNGQGRIAGFVFQTGSESPVVTVVHLDHPGATLEIRLPLDCGELVKDLPTPEPQPRAAFEKMLLSFHFEGSWKVCFPAPDLAVICGGDRILIYTLPSFSALPHGKHSLDEVPTWRLYGVMEHNMRTSADVFYDPSLPNHRYNIHFLRQLDSGGSRTSMGLTTLNIDPSNSSSETPTYNRIESQFWIDGFVTTYTLHPDIYHPRTRTHSEGLDVWVASLEDISYAQANGEEEGQGPLYMFVSNDELEPDLEWESVGLDEASGRVLIWGPTYRWMTPSETRVFVGELVS